MEDVDDRSFSLTPPASQKKRLDPIRPKKINTRRNGTLIEEVLNSKKNINFSQEERNESYDNEAPFMISTPRTRKFDTMQSQLRNQRQNVRQIDKDCVVIYYDDNFWWPAHLIRQRITGEWRVQFINGVCASMNLEILNWKIDIPWTPTMFSSYEFYDLEFKKWIDVVVADILPNGSFLVKCSDPEKSQNVAFNRLQWRKKQSFYDEL